MKFYTDILSVSDMIMVSEDSATVHINTKQIDD